MNDSTINEHSVITKTRRRKFCLASSDATKPLAAITHIALGDAGVDAQGEPLDPTEAQTALNNEVARYPVDGVSYPVDTTARYTVTIPKADLAGKKLTEAALVDSDGDLAAIKNFYVKQKDAGVAFTFEFDDEF